MTRLITGKKPTVRNIASRLVDRVDQSNLNRFLILYERDGEELNRRRLEMLQSMKEMRWRRDGVVAIDERLYPRLGGRFLKLEGFGTQLQVPCPRSMLRTSHYMGSEKDYPTDYRQRFKRGS